MRHRLDVIGQVDVATVPLIRVRSVVFEDFRTCGVYVDGERDGRLHVRMAVHDERGAEGEVTPRAHVGMDEYGKNRFAAWAND